MTNQKQPTSKFEKFLTGLQAIVRSQPGARMDFGAGKQFLVGNTADPFISSGMKEYLSGLGFKVDDQKEMFSFTIKDE